MKSQFLSSVVLSLAGAVGCATGLEAEAPQSPSVSAKATSLDGTTTDLKDRAYTWAQMEKTGTISAQSQPTGTSDGKDIKSLEFTSKIRMGVSCDGEGGAFTALTDNFKMSSAYYDAKKNVEVGPQVSYKSQAGNPVVYSGLKTCTIAGR